jgi:hypothetical protein
MAMGGLMPPSRSTVSTILILETRNGGFRRLSIADRAGSENIGCRPFFFS